MGRRIMRSVSVLRIGIVTALFGHWLANALFDRDQYTSERAQPGRGSVHRAGPGCQAGGGNNTGDGDNTWGNDGTGGGNNTGDGGGGTGTGGGGTGGFDT